MWRGQRIAVVVPAFNEAALIAGMLRGIPDFVDRVFVVDDASSDATADVVNGVGATRVSLIRHRVNRGVGAAIVTGYERALAEGFDWLGVMAGDGQMAPEDLPRLLEAAQHADYVKGNRFRHPSVRRMPLLRRVGSGFLSWLTRAATGLDVDDCQCGYTLLSARFAARLPLAELWPRYGYPNDLLAMLGAHGARVVEVPVKAVYGVERSGLHAGHVVLIAGLILKRRGYWGPPRAARTG